ncbi:ATP-dependent Clp protease adapter ClpS [Nocardioides salsibiostraticola]
MIVDGGGLVWLVHGPECATMWDVSAAMPTEVEPDLESDISPEEVTQQATPWVTIVWNDPVNLMSYVAYVFSKYFGYDKKKSDRLMMEVHQDGKSVVSTGSREEMERDVQAMHEYGLWATISKAD